MRKLLVIGLVLVSFLGINIKNVKADEKDLYDFMWLDPDKSVYVLQNKVFSKKGRFYSNLALAKGLSTDFQDTYGGVISAGYYISEEWGIELVYAHLSNKDDEGRYGVKTVP